MRHANLPAFRVFRAKVNRALVTGVLLMATSALANAGGPRWVSGPPYFTNLRVMISWYTNHPLYFTDSGDLSPSVNHAAADEMVARAAAIWNIQTASLVLAQGGTLNEHVSGANVYAGSNGLVFPADVQGTNYAAKQIAVIYDADGSITDMLLGSGASDPTGCLQSGVTESVDLITPQAQIQHAILILNGRCTGPQPEKQLQMQYQLERAFGRVLGLGWSQTNDNVFTGYPAPTQMQALNWPIMHPIDIVCGPYTYQCLPQPFTLRPDDISSLEGLYFIPQGQAVAGKMASWTNAGGTYGRVAFPDGQGMEGVNVVVRRRLPFFDTAEAWQTASSVTGYSFRGQSATSIVAQSSSAAASMGTPYGEWEGYWRIQTIPVIPSADFNDLVVSTEAINPLYTGPYAIGPMTGDTMSPSGTAQTQVSQYLASGRDNYVSFTPQDAAATCSTQADGSEGAPAGVPQGGWWTGTLCGYGHQAWTTIPVKANRTLTLEVTALNEEGMVSMTKAMPILGAWKSTDATGTLPTAGSAAHAFNSFSVAMTTLQLQSSGSSAMFRVAIADQRGAGRPDFAYQARALYADSVSPASVGADGGTVTITGMGFRQGNAVLVNGIDAIATSWSPTSITVTVPSLQALGLSRATTATLTVKDVSTGGSSAMTGVLSYAAPVEALHLVSAPAGSVPAGRLAATSFSVKAIAPDGFTPIVGEAVSFASSGAAVALSPCASASCIMLTNSAGIASVAVTPTAQGSVTLTATGRSGTAAASFSAIAETEVMQVVSAPASTIYIGDSPGAAFTIRITASDGATPVAGKAVTFSVASGGATFSTCGLTSCTVLTDAAGIASAAASVTSPGQIRLLATADAGTVDTTISAAQRIRSVAGVKSVLYLAEGVSFAWVPEVSLADNSASTAGVPVSWASTPGLRFPGTFSTSDGAGLARATATAGPMLAGAATQGYACSWGTICAPVTVHGVGASEWRLTILSGAAQSVPSSDSLGPVELRVEDTYGDPIAGAVVQVDQTISTWQASCPASGRCPEGTILALSSSSATSDENGVIRIAPAQGQSGLPAVTRIAAIAGSQGFATFSLERHP